MRHVLASSIILVMLVTTASTAAAQAAPEPPFARDGLMLGFSVGGGSFEVACESCPPEERFEGGALTLHVGGMLNQRLAVLLDVWAVTHHVDLPIFDYNVTAAFNTAAVRYFLGPKLWAQAGLGGAFIKYHGAFCDDPDECKSESVFALVAAIGYEVWRGRAAVLDVQLRGGMASGESASGSMSSLQVGFSWY